MSGLDLFPETLPKAAPQGVEWTGTTLNAHGDPRVTLRLIAKWSEAGWTCGWFVMLDSALDEWHPAAPNEYRRHAHYPWYRLPEMPQSPRFAVAAAVAARAAKIVLHQMTEYALDQAAVADAHALSAQIEQQAQRWLVGADLGAEVTA